jgi:hypothetical protein
MFRSTKQFRTWSIFRNTEQYLLRVSVYSKDMGARLREVTAVATRCMMCKCTTHSCWNLIEELIHQCEATFTFTFTFTITFTATSPPPTPITKFLPLLQRHQHWVADPNGWLVVSVLVDNNTDDSKCQGVELFSSWVCEWTPQYSLTMIRLWEVFMCLQVLLHDPYRWLKWISLTLGKSFLNLIPPLTHQPISAKSRFTSWKN